MQVSETVIRDVVAQVLAEVGQIPPIQEVSYAGRHGVFEDVNEAVAAAS